MTIIAEAGVNHNGDLNTALKLVDAAADARADYVKFQTFKSEKLTISGAKKARYQTETTDASESQQDMLKKLELTPKMHERIIEHCREKGIGFMSTPFEPDSLKYLLTLDIDAIKLSSGDVTNFLLLRETAKTGKKIILSTGMSTMEEVEAAVDVLKEYGAEDITLLHCNTQYPTPFDNVNLRAMQAMEDKFGLPVGYSDHTRGIEVPIAAVAMGASVIEKHFTLDRNMEGPDHRASLEPDELKAMVSAIRNIECALGDGVKNPTKSEKENISVARKSIVAAADIKCGDIFSEDNLACKRPGTGISPMKWVELVGKKAKKDYAEDELIDISEINQQVCGKDNR